MNNRIILVLSGGGVKGVAHITLIEKLLEWKNYSHSKSETSVRVVVAPLYVSGLTTTPMLQFFKPTPLFKISYLNPGKSDSFDLSKYARIFNGFVPLNFEDIMTPIFVAVFKLQKVCIEYFNNGSLIESFLASCAILPIYSPVLIRNALYTDGGIIDNFPIAPLRFSANRFIVSYVVGHYKKEENYLNTILKGTNHASSLLLHVANFDKLSQVDIPINFPLGNYDLFNTASTNGIHNSTLGYLNGQELKNSGYFKKSSTYGIAI